MQLLLTHTQIVNSDNVQNDVLAIDTRRGRILDSAQVRNPTVVDLSGYMVLPGLINAHDHLELNHYPRTKFRDVYANAHQWGEDVSQRLTETPFKELQNYALRERCLSGGLKNILAGVTTVAHHNPLHRALKSRHFPVHVLRDYGWAHSLHFADVATIQTNHRQSAPHPFMIHLAEGTDALAQAELHQLADLGVLDTRTVLIHGVGLTENDTHFAIERGVSLVWCPSTNDYLLGQTAQVQSWAHAGRLMLGSDSRLTADGDLLDELRSAQATEQLTAQQLFHLVTSAPAQLLNLSQRGALEPTFHADLIILPIHNNPYETLIQTQRADINLVMCSGKIIIGDPDLVRRFPQGKFVDMQLDGQPKLMARRLAKAVQRSQIKEVGLEI